MRGICRTGWPMICALSLGPIVPVACLAADEHAEPQNAVVLDNNLANGNTGRLAVNLAAGNHNQQASSALIALGEVAIVQGAIAQHSASTGYEDSANLVVIGPGAFAGISGLASINLTAGTQNQSANQATLAIGQSGALSDQLLQQTRAPIEPSGSVAQTQADPNDTVVIGENAFGGGTGLFQGNLIGGERNSSANTFSLTVAVGGQP